MDIVDYITNYFTEFSEPSVTNTSNTTTYVYLDSAPLVSNLEITQLPDYFNPVSDKSKISDTNKVVLIDNVKCDKHIPGKSIVPVINYLTYVDLLNKYIAGNLAYQKELQLLRDQLDETVKQLNSVTEKLTSNEKQIQQAETDYEYLEIAYRWVLGMLLHAPLKRFVLWLIAVWKDSDDD